LNGEWKARQDQQMFTERRRRRAVLATGTASSVKYRGAAPVRQRCMSTHSLTSHAQAPAASEGPSATVLLGGICERLLTGEQLR